MHDDDSELKNMLNSTELDGLPDPARMQAVRQEMMNIASRGGRPRRFHTAPIVALIVVGICAISLAATQTGRDFIRWIFTPIAEEPVVTWEAPDGDVWSRTTTGRSEPYTPEEEDQATTEMSELHEIQQDGGGRLVGLSEGPGFVEGMTSSTTYMIEYTLDSGATISVGSSRPTGKQAENMRIDEIMNLRDAGAGEIISEQPFEIGLGYYTVRLTLSDGQTVDLQTFYPPSTLEERERIFAEIGELKKQLRFAVQNPFVDQADPQAGVWGLLLYTLADGRTVGATGPVPQEAISKDGTHVVLPDLEAPIAIQGASAGPH